MTEPRIYVANLAAYNAGKLVGEWIEASSDIDEMLEAIAKIAPNDAEWAIHDSEGLPKFLQKEHADLADIAKFADLCTQYDGELVRAAVDNFHDVDEAEKHLRDNFAGIFSTLEGFAEQTMEDFGDLRNLPDHLRCYFDFAALARDMELGGDIWTADVSDGVAVFWNR